MAERLERLQHLFIVRIWQEPSATAPPGQWRGSAEHIPSGQRFYFSSIEELDNGILEQMNRAAMAPTTGDDILLSGKEAESS
jgi:hypothetical protein